jgi:hypothetical protein
LESSAKRRDRLLAKSDKAFELSDALFRARKRPFKFDTKKGYICAYSDLENYFLFKALLLEAQAKLIIIKTW